MLRLFKKLSIVLLALLIIAVYLITNNFDNKFIYNYYVELYHDTWLETFKAIPQHLINQKDYKKINNNDQKNIEKYINNSLNGFNRHSRNRDLLKDVIDQYCNSSLPSNCRKYITKYLNALFDQKLAGRYASQLSNETLIRCITLSTSPDANYISLVSEANDRGILNYNYYLEDWVTFIRSFNSNLITYDSEKSVFIVDKNQFIEIPSGLDFILSSKKKVAINCETNCNVRESYKNGIFVLERKSNTVFHETRSPKVTIHFLEKAKFMIKPTKKN